MFQIHKKRFKQFLSRKGLLKLFISLYDSYGKHTDKMNFYSYIEIIGVEDVFNEMLDTDRLPEDGLITKEYYEKLNAEWQEVLNPEHHPYTKDKRGLHDGYLVYLQSWEQSDEETMNKSLCKNCPNFKGRVSCSSQGKWRICGECSRYGLNISNIVVRCPFQATGNEVTTNEPTTEQAQENPPLTPLNQSNTNQPMDEQNSCIEFLDFNNTSHAAHPLTENEMSLTITKKSRNLAMNMPVSKELMESNHLYCRVAVNNLTGETFLVFNDRDGFAWRIAHSCRATQAIRTTVKKFLEFISEFAYTDGTGRHLVRISKNLSHESKQHTYKIIK